MRVAEYGRLRPRAASKSTLLGSRAALAPLNVRRGQTTTPTTKTLRRVGDRNECNLEKRQTTVCGARIGTRPRPNFAGTVVKATPSKMGQPQ